MNKDKSSPERGGGPSKTVDGQGQDRMLPTSPLPLHHPSGGPPPRSGEELSPVRSSSHTPATP